MKKLNQTNKTRNQTKAKIHKHICEGIQSVTEGKDQVGRKTSGPTTAIPSYHHTILTEASYLNLIHSVTKKHISTYKVLYQSTYNPQCVYTIET